MRRTDGDPPTALHSRGATSPLAAAPERWDDGPRRSRPPVRRACRLHRAARRQRAACSRPRTSSADGRSAGQGRRIAPPARLRVSHAPVVGQHRFDHGLDSGARSTSSVQQGRSLGMFAHEMVSWPVTNAPHGRVVGERVRGGDDKVEPQGGVDRLTTAAVLAIRHDLQPVTHHSVTRRNVRSPIGFPGGDLLKRRRRATAYAGPITVASRRARAACS